MTVEDDEWKRLKMAEMEGKLNEALIRIENLEVESERFVEEIYSATRFVKKLRFKGEEKWKFK